MSSLPAGWYRDPADTTTQRYWDGEGWLGKAIPATDTPRAASGRAIRPVPIANSSARPPGARAARKSTAGPSTWGAYISGDPSSYRDATS